MEWATWRLADFEERNKIGADDGWTLLSRAIFCGHVKFMDPALRREFGGDRALFCIKVLEDGVSGEDFLIETALDTLLNFMELLGDTPEELFSTLQPQHAALAARGQHLREQQPPYMEQQRAAVVAHCPLPTVLQSIVAAYAAPTPLDIWTDGLRIQVPGEKRARVAADVDQADDGLPQLRHSLRLQHK
jgi:hypothetical protein